MTLGRNTLNKIDETEMIDQNNDQNESVDEEACLITNKQSTFKSGSSELQRAMMSPKLMKINAMSKNLLNS